MAGLDNLNEQQGYAATYDGKHLMVIAGAGTGKTRTIIARASYLIRKGFIKAMDIKDIAYLQRLKVRKHLLPCHAAVP